MGRFSRSWALIKASGTVLRQDKELLVFPLCSALAAIVVIASFFVPLLLSGTLERMGDAEGMSPDVMLLMFAFYLCQYFVIFFFNTALVGAAMIRLNGGDPTVADGLRIARSKLWTILGYASIAATVGLILRVIEERAGWLGRWIVRLLGVAFTVATFLAVPVVVSRDVGPLEAITESATLLKRTWGENVIGNSGLGFVFFLAYLAIAVAGGVLLYFSALTGSGAVTMISVVLVIIAIVAAALIQVALQGVYSAALYRYATEGDAGNVFPQGLLGDAFKPKK